MMNSKFKMLLVRLFRMNRLLQLVVTIILKQNERFITLRISSKNSYT